MDAKASSRSLNDGAEREVSTNRSKGDRNSGTSCALGRQAIPKQKITVLGHPSPPEPPGLLLLPSDHYTFAQSAARIFGELAKTYMPFTRGGRVVELHSTRHGPELSVLRPAALQSRLDRNEGLVMVHAIVDGKLCLKPKRRPGQMAEVLLESQEAREHLPPTVSLSAAPVLIEDDGEPKVLGPGYHPEGGGILVTGGTMPPTVTL